MAKSAEQISAFLNNEIPASPPRVVAVEEEQLLPRELSFGLYLRRERILRGISRDDVIRVTKVSLAYVEALEANQFGALPPKAFVVGFLRVFSKYAGLNEDEIVNRFLTESAEREAYESPAGRRPGWRQRHWKIVLVIAGALALVALMLAPLFRSGV